MVVMLDGTVMAVKVVIFSKASPAMAVTLPSVGITLSLHPASRVLVAVSIRQLPLLWYTLFPAST